MSLIIILLIVLLIGGVGVAPNWGPTANWGYAPGGLVGLILVIVLVMWLVGGVRF